jgi:hypothetical protein
MQRDNLIVEILVSILIIGLTVVVYLYMNKHMRYTQSEAEEEANLKRLFGEAWKEAKDL